MHARSKRRCQSSDLRSRYGQRARGKGLDDLAVGDCSVTAGSDHPVKFAAQRGQIGDLAVDFGEVDTRNPVNCIAGLGLIIR